MKHRDGITTLYDAITRRSDVRPDWGYAALVEIDSHRILFDTGNHPEILNHNCAALGIDLAEVNCAVLSHRHGDHTAGLQYVLRVNPGIKISVPDDEFFGGETPRGFYAHTHSELPAEQRYFRGMTPSSVPHGSAWPQAHFRAIEKPTSIGERLLLVPVGQDRGGLDQINELSLVLLSDEGATLMVGCSHAGIECHIEAARKALPQTPLRRIVGGVHLAAANQAVVSATVQTLIESGAELCLGHCTGERAFSLLLQQAPERFIYAGAGEFLPM